MPTSSAHRDVGSREGARRDPPPRVERAPGAAAALIVIGIALCVGAYTVAVRAAGASFTWRHAMVSDLGRSVCRDWNGHWVCSPSAAAFNVAVAGAGVSLVLAAVLARRHLEALALAALACLGVGLAWVAVFPADGPIGVHMVGGVLALPAPSVLLLLHGVVAERHHPTATSRSVGALGAASALMSLDHVMPAPAPLARGVAEGISLLALAAALVIVVIDLVRHAHGDPGP